MAGRVFLHVGSPKTGTSFLQSVVWRNRASLRQHGIAVPAAKRHHYHAALYVRDSWSWRPAAELIAADWDRLSKAVHRSKLDVLITHELLAHASADQARHAIEVLGGTETHVVITARDLARQVPAEWQQSVKQGSIHRFDDYVRDVVHHGPRAKWFWRVQDVPAVAQRWGATLPNSRVHIVTCPPKGADPTVLWARFASVLGVDPDVADVEDARSNESLGRVEVELMRRINEVRSRLPQATGSDRWFRDVLANERLARRPDKEKFGVPQAAHDQIMRTSRDTVAVLGRRGYDVVGDLAELVPPAQAEPGLDPSLVDEHDVLVSALETIVDLMHVHRAAITDLRESKGRPKPGE